VVLYSDGPASVFHSDFHTGAPLTDPGAEGPGSPRGGDPAHTADDSAGDGPSTPQRRLGARARPGSGLSSPLSSAHGRPSGDSFRSGSLSGDLPPPPPLGRLRGAVLWLASTLLGISARDVVNGHIGSRVIHPSSPFSAGNE
jgi:hypothetical protein